METSERAATSASQFRPCTVELQPDTTGSHETTSRHLLTRSRRRHRWCLYFFTEEALQAS